jgi:hypothetical protein
MRRPRGTIKATELKAPLSKMRTKSGEMIFSGPFWAILKCVCELGGMRYIHAEPTESNPLPGHQMVHRLGKHLGLTAIEFPMGDGNGMYYLRLPTCLA